MEDRPAQRAELEARLDEFRDAGSRRERARGELRRAEERLATFLLSLSERFRARGFSASAFVLRMSRQEIGSYLGMKLETVSRVFSRFREQGLLDVQ